MAFDKFKEGLKDITEKGIEAAKEKTAERKEDKKELKERIAQMDREGTAYCPKCYSTDLSANKRGFKLTTGVIGMNKIVVTCMKCR